MPTETILWGIAMFRLDNQVVWITGASKGIGQAVALDVARRGGIVWVTSRDGGACEQVAREINKAGGRAEAMECDVSDYGDVTKVAGQIFDTHGRLDTLVNNAGIIQPIGPLAESDPSEWIQNITVNLSGVMHGCRAVLPKMIQDGGGVIINVSSGAAMAPKEGWSAYCAAKAGVAMLTRSLDLENRAFGVRVYGFQPGVVDTDMQHRIRQSGINEVSRLKREQLAPVGEPAHIISWLMSPDAKLLAGRELSIRDPDLREQSGLVSYSGL